MAGTCADPNGWTGTDVIYVKERFAFFTHCVAVTVQRPWIMHEPFPPGQGPAEGPTPRPPHPSLIPNERWCFPR
jgi:hypothetical protein